MSTDRFTNSQPVEAQRPSELADIEGLMGLCTKALSASIEYRDNGRGSNDEKNAPLVAQMLKAVEAVGWQFEKITTALQYILTLEAHVASLQADRGEDSKRLDWLETQRPCTIQAWVQQVAIHKPGSMFEANEYHKTIRESIDAARIQQKE